MIAFMCQDGPIIVSACCDLGHDVLNGFLNAFTIYTRKNGAQSQKQRPRRCAGGPGSEAPRPTESSGWVNKATQYFSVVMLDQRGTGRSSPISVESLERIGGAQSQADYLQHFRSYPFFEAVFTKPRVWHIQSRSPAISMMQVEARGKV